MVHRTVICVVLVGVVGVALACGQVSSGGVSDEALRDPAVGVESEASITPGVGASDARLAPSAPAPAAKAAEIALNGLAGTDYDAIISFGLPIDPADSQ